MPVRQTESRITESRKTITTTDDSRTRSKTVIRPKVRRETPQDQDQSFTLVF